jgi:hypothetical protein
MKYTKRQFLCRCLPALLLVLIGTLGLCHRLIYHELPIQKTTSPLHTVVQVQSMSSAAQAQLPQLVRPALTPIIDETMLVALPREYLFDFVEGDIIPGERLRNVLHLTFSEVTHLKTATKAVVKSLRESSTSISQHGEIQEGTSHVHYDILPLPNDIKQKIKQEFSQQTLASLGNERAECFLKYFDFYSLQSPELRGFGYYKLRLSFSTLAGYGPGMTYMESILDERDEILFSSSKQSRDGIPEQYKGLFKVSE